MSRRHHRLVALYRKPSYSPAQHRCNDTQILDETLVGLEDRGWAVERRNELDVEEGRLPAADLYVNMCQGPRASAALSELAPPDSIAVNPPAAVLNCHRHRLVPRLVGTGVPFPRTMIIPTSGPEADAPNVETLNGDHRPIWVKRGDVHAERAEDVVSVESAGVRAAVATFAARGISSVALQSHVPGPIVKFYAVGAGGFFRWFPPAGTRVEVNEDRLQELAFAAAEALGLEIFGGDVALPDPESPVLIDINDWPSFAPVRSEAAAAIAGYVHERYMTGRYA